MKTIKEWFKYRFSWMDIFLSPFVCPKPIVHIGSVKVGTPYMLPRVWRPNPEKRGYLIAKARKFGFDFVGLGWKEKFGGVRGEWNPVWSLVLFGKFQIAVTWHLDCRIWESYLTWKYYTDRKDGNLVVDLSDYTLTGRLQESRTKNPNVWASRDKEGKEVKTDWFLKSLKKRFRDYFEN